MGVNWGFAGENLKYCVSKIMGGQFGAMQDNQNMRRRLYFQLGWDYVFEYDDDEVFFAYSLPYSFSMVSNFVQHI